ncbi:MAG: hypothetical protein CMJ31_13800 [Phycisphaerae bacterium]|nr:hypothetical protein [Phycisphaerae bacterium]
MNPHTNNRNARLLGAAAAIALAGAATAQSVLIDFGPDAIGGAEAETLGNDANGNRWNNFVPGRGLSLVDANNAPVRAFGSFGPALFFGAAVGFNVGATFVDPADGLLNPNSFFLGELGIASATQDYVFIDTALQTAQGTVQFDMANCNPDETYNFRFFGSRISGQDGFARYTVTGGNGAQTVELQTGGPNTGSDGASFGNDNTIVEITDVTPGTSNVIKIDISIPVDGMGAPIGEFGVLNALEIQIGSRVPDVAFTMQPQDAIVDAGGTLVFNAAATSNAGAVTYAWRRDGAALTDDNPRVSGSTSDTLTITGAGVGDVGAYTVVATVGGVPVSSDSAVGGVRQSAGAFDLDLNGVVDIFDALLFIEASAP